MQNVFKRKLNKGILFQFLQHHIITQLLNYDQKNKTVSTELTKIYIFNSFALDMKINTGNEEFEKLLSFKPKIFPPKKALKKSKRMKNQLRNEEVSSTLMGFTGYSQEEIVTWFSQFQQLCPSGLLTRKKV